MKVKRDGESLVCFPFLVYVGPGIDEGCMCIFGICSHFFKHKEPVPVIVIV